MNNGKPAKSLSDAERVAARAKICAEAVADSMDNWRKRFTAMEPYIEPSVSAFEDASEGKGGRSLAVAGVLDSIKAIYAHEGHEVDDGDIHGFVAFMPVMERVFRVGVTFGYGLAQEEKGRGQQP